jgi:branched-chain amino acid transport system substrate-binding protein
MQVKTPSESKEPWDLLRVVGVFPADKAFRPAADGGCPLVVK